ncbi:uncharacterized protein LOC120140617 isoform X2 [Hibiscus syriacus]|uniref:uncharacterized protein LOC120140617 isoform X1 n=1 Tax=Hibiscus syriacus TaxID=106335 RepID=UPI001921BEED|nr:uncharacterized protein LOC120140617 isoform X1 [Hibiscus syriacus]XP_039011514.1 uncharacterized protein LOC120140617 isoform X2 [Hibiscus syriacus]
MEDYSSSFSSALAPGLKNSQSFQPSLHSVRKPMGKPWKKPAVSPLQPTPLKVYRVDPVNFRGLVQKLTGGATIVPADSLSQHQTPSTRLRRVAPQPPPLQVAPPQPLHMVSGLYHTKPQNQKFCDESSDSLGLNLSPSSYNWCSFLRSYVCLV